MNFLAHLYLAPADPTERIANLLPDLLTLPEQQAMPAVFQTGMALHREVDRFTDAHPEVVALRGRFPTPYRRVAGILVDIFFDHLLARGWSHYTDQPLANFTKEVYQGFATHPAPLPPRAAQTLAAMQRLDWLGSYAGLDGITTALGRMDQRLRRPMGMAQAVTLLHVDSLGIEASFGHFFPDLVGHVRRHDPSE